MDISSVANMVNTYRYKKQIENGQIYDSGFENLLNETANSMERELIDEKVTQNGSIELSSVWEGDIVQTLTDKLSTMNYGNGENNKQKSEMSMAEYKQWFMSQTAGFPVSGWVKSTFSSTTLVIKEEAFERMKDDPEYEKYVMNRIKSFYSASGLCLERNNVAYEVIGGSPEECYGYAGPIGDEYGTIFDKNRSWWQKRHDEVKEITEEQIKKSKEKKAAEKKAVKKQLEYQQFSQDYLSSRFFSKQHVKSEMSATEASYSSVAASYEFMMVACGTIVRED